MMVLGNTWRKERKGRVICRQEVRHGAARLLGQGCPAGAAGQS